MTINDENMFSTQKGIFWLSRESYPRPLSVSQEVDTLINEKGISIDDLHLTSSWFIQAS